MVIDDQVLARLPIFPLPDVVLFPGTILPLHVFEPRYVEMTRDVVGGSRRIGIVRLRPGYQSDYQGRPPIYPVATLGEVIACQELPDDRFAMIVRGSDRIAVTRELPALRAYREVAAIALPDRAVDEREVAIQRHQLVAVCEQLAARLGDEGVWLRQLVHAADGASALSHALAASLVRDPDRRQELFEQCDPATRIDQLLEHASGLLSRLGAAPSAAN